MGKSGDLVKKDIMFKKIHRESIVERGLVHERLPWEDMLSNCSCVLHEREDLKCAAIVTYIPEIANCER